MPLLLCILAGILLFVVLLLGASVRLHNASMERNLNALSRTQEGLSSRIAEIQRAVNEFILNATPPPPPPCVVEPMARLYNRTGTLDGVAEFELVTVKTVDHTHPSGTMLTFFEHPNVKFPAREFAPIPTAAGTFEPLFPGDRITLTSLPDDPEPLVLNKEYIIRKVQLDNDAELESVVVTLNVERDDGGPVSTSRCSLVTRGKSGKAYDTAVFGPRPVPTNLQF